MRYSVLIVSAACLTLAACGEDSTSTDLLKQISASARETAESSKAIAASLKDTQETLKEIKAALGDIKNSANNNANALKTVSDKLATIDDDVKSHMHTAFPITTEFPVSSSSPDTLCADIGPYRTKVIRSISDNRVVVVCHD